MATKKKKKIADDEVVFEDTNVSVTGAKGALEKAKKALRACEKERKEYLDGWKRTKADALNDKKRQKRCFGAGARYCAAEMCYNHAADIGLCSCCNEPKT